MSQILFHIASLPIMTEAEEREIIPRWQREHRQEDVDRIVRGNTGFLVDEVTAFVHKHDHLDINDLFQEAVCGLLRAAERFDPDKGFKFITYAVWWIRQALLMYSYKHGTVIRRPAHVLFDWDGNKRGTRKKSRRWIEPFVIFSLDYTPITSNPFPNSESRSPHDILESPVEDPSATVERTERIHKSREIIELVLKKFDSRTQLVLIKKFGLDGKEPWTLQQIGDNLGISRERVRQIIIHNLPIMAKEIRKHPAALVIHEEFQEEVV